MTRYRTPTPDRDYLELLGRAAYTWAYTEWMLLYVIKWATEEDLAALVGGTGGRIVRRFHKVVNDPRRVGHAVDTARAGADELLRLNHRRNDILHARPATVEGEQQLHRWDPTHSNATSGTITATDLGLFITEVEAARGRISGFAESLRPK